MVLGGFRKTSKNWQGPKRLMVYCHGGLNSEKASAARIASLQPYFLANEVYPLHFTALPIPNRLAGLAH